MFPFLDSTQNLFPAFLSLNNSDNSIFCVCLYQKYWWLLHSLFRNFFNRVIILMCETIISRSLFHCATFEYFVNDFNSAIFVEPRRFIYSILPSNPVCVLKLCFESLYYHYCCFEEWDLRGLWIYFLQIHCTLAVVILETRKKWWDTKRGKGMLLTFDNCV